MGYTYKVGDKPSATQFNDLAQKTDLAASGGAGMVGFAQPGTGSVTRTLQSKEREFVSVTDKGAIGDGAADDTLAFTNATALGLPAYVPYTANFYSLTALSTAALSLLWGPGVVKVAGAIQQISSVPTVSSTTMPGVSIFKPALAPAKWPTVVGAVGNGALNADVTRSGGFGQYGNIISQYYVSAPVVSGEFDVGITSWLTTTNLTAAGAQAFGMWAGANTPSSALGQTFTGGAAIGMEINVGNRWADFGLQLDVGGARYTTGLQIVPDVLPAKDGTTAAVYPGNFGVVIGQSVTGHKWWVGTLLRGDTIMAGGYGHIAHGGNVIGNAPEAWAAISGYWNKGLDFTGATFSNAAINFSFANSNATTATAGGIVPPTNVQGYIKVAISGSIVKIPYYNN